MAISKKILIEFISTMFEEELADTNAIIRCIWLLDKIEKAENNIFEGKVYTTPQAKKRLSKWLH